YLVSLLVFYFSSSTAASTSSLSLHDALPISRGLRGDSGSLHRVHVERVRDPRLALLVLRPRGDHAQVRLPEDEPRLLARVHRSQDRKSTRLNSSHVKISYAVFCLKKKIRQKW